MTHARTLAISLLATVLFAGLLTVSCAKSPFFRPRGASVASCNGVMRLDTGSRVRFTVDLYKDRDELALYLSIPSKGVRYSRVTDIDFGGEGVRIETESSRVYTGGIAAGDLKFKGEWGEFKGAMTLKMRE